MNTETLIEKLNAATGTERLFAVRELKKRLDGGIVRRPADNGFTNNHVHTRYSFSPYSPAYAVWAAVMSGLSTVGLVDHDAVNGAEEFVEAGRILRIATTVGFEMRTDFAGTPLAGKRINNPDQTGSAYIVAHGLPHTQFINADGFLKPVRRARGQRNRKMLERLNGITEKHGIAIDYDRDVLPLSYAKAGGTVTERHLLFALALKAIREYGKGERLIRFVSGKLDIRLTDKQRSLLSDTENEHYAYDLLNVLKGGFLSRIYVQTDRAETPPVRDAVSRVRELGAIPTYCYLGDVTASPTGDKKAQAFEDQYLKTVFETCRDIGFQAVAYMPSRNTEKQLLRVMALCREYGFLEISGEDINQPRQSFVCPKLKDPEYAHLADTTWALVGHEVMAAENPNNGLFADSTKQDAGERGERIRRYMRIGRKSLEERN